MVEWANGRACIRQFILSNAPVVAVCVCRTIGENEEKRKEHGSEGSTQIKRNEKMEGKLFLPNATPSTETEWNEMKWNETIKKKSALLIVKLRGETQ